MKTLLALLCCLFLISCDNDGPDRNNPYLLGVPVSIIVDTQLPAYNNLQYPGNGVYISNAGMRGIIVFFTGSQYNAFDAACPNQALSSCSTLQYNNSSTAVCPCDEAIYSMYTADSPGLQYRLYQYRTEVSGTRIRIFN